MLRRCGAGTYESRQASLPTDTPPREAQRAGSGGAAAARRPTRLGAARRDFTSADGEFFGIAGHTGSGKSTLIQHMNGLLHPTVRARPGGGTRPGRQGARAGVRARVGVVFQYPEHQLFAATVYHDVAFGPRNLELSDEEVDARVRESLALVGLDFDEMQANASPFELSGGQQRRVAFAGVLAMRPPILVLDEPVAGLDPRRARVPGAHRRAACSGPHGGHGLAQHGRPGASVRPHPRAERGRARSRWAPAEVFADAEELRGIGLGVPAASASRTTCARRGSPSRRACTTRIARAATLTVAAARRAGALRRSGCGMPTKRHSPSAATGRDEPRAPHGPAREAAAALRPHGGRVLRPERGRARGVRRVRRRRSTPRRIPLGERCAPSPAAVHRGGHRASELFFVPGRPVLFEWWIVRISRRRDRMRRSSRAACAAAAGHEPAHAHHHDARPHRRVRAPALPPRPHRRARARAVR